MLGRTVRTFNLMARVLAAAALVLGLSHAEAQAEQSALSSPGEQLPLTFWAEPLLLTFDRDQTRGVGSFSTERIERVVRPAFRGEIGIQTPWEDTALTVRGFLYNQIRTGSASRPQFEHLTVKTWSTDFALTKLLRPNDYLEFDLSMGARYNEYLEIMRDDADIRIHDFKGAGPLLGLEARAYLQKDDVSKFAVFARTRGAVLFGDGFRTNDTDGPNNLDGRVREQLEVAAGIEASRTAESGFQFFARIFAEFQWLADHTSKFAPPTAAAPNLPFDENAFGRPGDAFLYGGGLRVGLRW